MLFILVNQNGYLSDSKLDKKNHTEHTEIEIHIPENKSLMTESLVM